MYFIFVCDTYLFFVYNSEKTDTLLIYGEYHKNSCNAATESRLNGALIDITHLITFLCGNQENTDKSLEQLMNAIVIEDHIYVKIMTMNNFRC